MRQTKRNNRSKAGVVLALAGWLALGIGGRTSAYAVPADISVPEVVVVKKSKTAKTNYVYPTLQLANLKDFRPHAVALDGYGGRTDLKGKTTGFFHTEKLGERWFLIDPEGGGVYQRRHQRHWPGTAGKPGRVSKNV